MTQVILFTNANGGVAMCIPTGESSIEQVRQKDIPVGVESFVVEHSSLPHEDIDFFDAWEQTSGVVSVNLTKAKSITKDRLRFDRAPLLATQDIAFQRALETGSDTTAIIAEKQRLRDITNLADGCATLAELRSLHC